MSNNLMPHGSLLQNLTSIGFWIIQMSHILVVQVIQAIKELIQQLKEIHK
jgi:hypothetical protein